MTLATWRLRPSSASANVPSCGIPEGLVERFAQVLRLAAQAQLRVGVPERRVDLGDRELGAIDIALCLDERDRALGEAAIGVHDRVVGVLPPLVAQASGRAALVLDEPVAVAIAELVDPPQRAVERRTQAA